MLNELKSVVVRPVVVSNKGVVNNYTFCALTSAMYLAGWHQILCREILIYDRHPICYDDQTEVLTEDGWKYFKDISYEDKICTLNENNIIEYQYPTDIISLKYNGKMFSLVNSRKIDIKVTPNHKLFVSQYRHSDKWYPFTLVEAQKIFNKKIRFKRDGKWIGKSSAYFYLPALSNAKRKRHREERLYTMDRWLEFFGYYISEGSVDKGKHGHYRVVIAQKQSEKSEKIKKCLIALNINFDYDGKTFRFYDKQFYEYLKQFGKAHQKFIPKEIKQLSSRQLRILLDAMMVGDGYSRKRISTRSISETLEKQYITSSKRLADDVQEILLKIGISGNIKILHKKGFTTFIKGRKIVSKYDCYTVSFVFKNKPRINELSMPRTARNVWVYYDGFVYCVIVPNHIIYVRRNGVPYWCGNSHARNVAVKEFMADKQNTHLLFIDDDVVPPVDFIVRLLQHDKLVVCGWYLYRGNRLPSVGDRTKHGWTWRSVEELQRARGLLSVDGVGAGCLMVKREVFDMLEYPYFLEDPETGVGEDLYFCSKLKRHNIPIFVDPTLYCRHFHWGLL